MQYNACYSLGLGIKCNILRVLIATLLLWGGSCDKIPLGDINDLWGSFAGLVIRGCFFLDILSVQSDIFRKVSSTKWRQSSVNCSIFRSDGKEFGTEA